MLGVPPKSENCEFTVTIYEVAVLVTRTVTVTNRMSIVTMTNRTPIVTMTNSRRQFVTVTQHWQAGCLLLAG